MMGCHMTLVISSKDARRIQIDELNERLKGKLIEFQPFEKRHGSYIGASRKFCREHHHYNDVDEGDTGREIFEAVVRSCVDDISMGWEGPITVFAIHEGGEYGEAVISIGKKE